MGYYGITTILPSTGSRTFDAMSYALYFFFIKHLYPGYPTRLEAVTNVGSCTTYLITQTIGLQHISTNIYTQLYTYMDYHMIW